MIEISKNTRHFFQKLLNDSLRDMREDLDPPVEIYVVFLLDDMAKTPYNEDPLGQRLLSLPDHRHTSLRDVGDRSLFVSGFFAERLKERGLSSTYFADISSSAYSELGREFPSPFKALSEKINLLQRALRGVRDACDAMGMDAWSTHEQWLRSRSPALERRLRQLGLFVLPECQA